MKKKMLCGLLSVGLIASLLVGCGKNATEGSTDDVATSSAVTEETEQEASYSAEAPLTLQIGNGVDEENPQTVALRNFGDALKEATAGRIVYELFPNCEIGSDEEMVEMVRTNTIQMSEANITLKDYEKEMYAFGLPYLFHSYDDAYNYLTNSDNSKEMWSNLETNANLKKVAIYLNGARALTTKGVDVKSPADLKGKKIRSMTSEVSQDTITSLGGTPVPMSYSELYVALQTGVVDGQDNGLSNVYSSKFYEVQDHFYKTEHGYTINAVYVNPEFYNTLTIEDKAIFDELAKKHLEDEYSDNMDAYYAEAEKALADAGMTIVEQKDMDMEAFYQAADEMIQEKYMADEVFANVVNDVKSFCQY